MEGLITKFRIQIPRILNWPFYGHCDAIAAAEAERSDTATQAMPLEGVQQRRQDACAACADGMPECHCATMHVHLGFRNAQFSSHCDGLHRKRLVDLEQVHVVQ